MNFKGLKEKKVKSSGIRVMGKDFDLIASILEKEKNSLVDTMPEEFKEKLREESFVAGGSIYSMYHTKNYKDIDIFIKTEELKVLIQNYFKKISTKISLFEGSQCWSGNYQKKYFLLTKNSLSYGTFQIVFRDLGEVDEVLSKFDFCHNMYAVELDLQKTPRVYAHTSNRNCFFNKDIVYNKKRARDLVGTIIRVKKYLDRGMTMETKELAAMLLDLEKCGFSQSEIETLNSKVTNQTFGS